MLLPTEHIPMFTLQDWCTLYPQEADSFSRLMSSINIMSWNSWRALFVQGNFINSRVKAFILHVDDMIKAYGIDTIWINDGRCTARMLYQYIPIILKALPDGQIFQLPTYMIQTDSRCESKKCMRGAIAIVTHRWKSFVTRSIPCSTESGPINVLDIAVGPYNIHSINPYFLPTSPGKGPATIYTRVAECIKGKTSPAWANKFEPQKYLFAYAQQLANTAHLNNGSSLHKVT
jgi:hypothetical protein